ncbi:MAG: hypothetical protein F6K14_03395 [Symploca sp. SIO2C1]|nr:hypothetical protein [Symploca sp. SIO2C1]
MRKLEILIAIATTCFLAAQSKPNPEALKGLQKWDDFCQAKGRKNLTKSYIEWRCLLA